MCGQNNPNALVSVMPNMFQTSIIEGLLSSGKAAVLAPLNGAACIQKSFFYPSDYHIKNA